MRFLRSFLLIKSAQGLHGWSIKQWKNVSLNADLMASSPPRRDTHPVNFRAFCEGGHVMRNTYRSMLRHGIRRRRRGTVRPWVCDLALARSMPTSPNPRPGRRSCHRTCVREVRSRDVRGETIQTHMLQHVTNPPSLNFHLIPFRTLVQSEHNGVSELNGWYDVVLTPHLKHSPMLRGFRPLSDWTGLYSPPLMPKKTGFARQIPNREHGSKNWDLHKK